MKMLIVTEGVMKMVVQVLHMLQHQYQMTKHVVVRKMALQMKTMIDLYLFAVVAELDVKGE